MIFDDGLLFSLLDLLAFGSCRPKRAQDPSTPLSVVQNLYKNSHAGKVADAWSLPIPAEFIGISTPNNEVISAPIATDISVFKVAFIV